MPKKKYALVGTGGRARMFYTAVCKEFAETSELVAFCDINQTRMDYANKAIKEDLGYEPVATYKSEQFEEMIKAEKPDTVIVTTIDRAHHKYIISAMEHGCDVISEKPLTVDAEKCQAILDVVKRTGKELRVTFNYRYAPINTKIRELVMDGAIGEVYSAHLEWMLDTTHGADYFRRWHRDKRNSGGLMVHKATHHFDLVNFWLGTRPKTVYAMGDLRFYGRENAENRGVTKFYQRASDSEYAKNDPFAIPLEDKERLKAMYLDAEWEDGYQRDQSVFGDGISIEDTIAVMVRYQNKAVLSYSLNAFVPWEGYNLSLNGSTGRLEAQLVNRTYINAGVESAAEGAHRVQKITILPIWKEPYEVKVETPKGGHGGGDPVLVKDIFGPPTEDRFNRAASHIDGAWSILTGIAANESFNTSLPVDVEGLVKF